MANSRSDISVQRVGKSGQFLDMLYAFIKYSPGTNQIQVYVIKLCMSYNEFMAQTFPFNLFQDVTGKEDDLRSAFKTKYAGDYHFILTFV